MNFLYSNKKGKVVPPIMKKIPIYKVYICRGSISRIETGDRAVTDIEIDAISKVLNVSLDELFGRQK